MKNTFALMMVGLATATKIETFLINREGGNYDNLKYPKLGNNTEAFGDPRVR